MAKHRRIRALLEMRARAAAAARASSSPHPAPAAPAAPAPRSLPRGLVGDVMAALRGRGQASRACAVARISAVGAEVDAATSAAVTRVRAVGADVDAATSAAVACIRAVGTEVEARTTDALASAHARARVAQACFLRAQRRGGAAADVAGKRMREGWDAAIHRVLVVLYGESYLHGIKELDVSRIITCSSRLLKLWEYFHKCDPDQQALLLAAVLAPFAVIATGLSYIIPSETISTAPETTCMFLEISVLSSSDPVLECLMAVISLSAWSVVVIVMVIGDVVKSVIIDAYQLLELTGEKVAEEIRKTFNIKNQFTREEDRKVDNYLDLACQTIADMIKGKTPKEIRKTFNVKNDFTPEEEGEVRKEKQ